MHPNRTARPPHAAPDRKPRYDRARDLPLLLPIWPADLSDTSRDGRARLIARLRRALRAERVRGLAGHWTYDLSRHAQLRAALDAELAGSPPAPSAARARGATGNKKGPRDGEP